jgi:hypothetical protein
MMLIYNFTGSNHLCCSLHPTTLENECMLIFDGGSFVLQYHQATILENGHARARF